MTLPDFDNFDSFGGALENYSAVEDPTTDEDASYRNKYVADVAMMTLTVARALVSFTGHATTPGDPGSGFVHTALWGSGPTLKPTVVHTGTGIYTITWPATVDDPLLETHTVNFRRAMAQVESSAGTFEAATAKVTAANVVRVYTYSGTTLNDLAAEIITVVVW